MYLLITVPTKLTTFSRCVIHGHDIASAGTQLFITLFLQPIVILPCTSGYSTGLLTRLGIMSSINQSCSSIGNVAVSHYAVISIALYPMIGPYYVLMSNPEYRKRVVELTTRAPKVTILQPVSLSS
ncbi:unnamed protein product [Auanema sp. JU1783]|nr:unnamed protein product [Auanema sp. JU1783]